VAHSNVWCCARWTHSPDGGLARMTRTSRVRKPYKGCLILTLAACRKVGWGRCEGRLKLWGAVGRAWVRPEKRARGDRAKFRSRPSIAHLRRVKPKGAASGPCTKHASGRQGLSKGSNPGTAACRAGPVLRHWVYRQEKRYVGSSRVETPWGAFREEEAPKG